MVVAGALAETFRFDILARSMEQIPELEVGCVLRIHNMRIETWQGAVDGRVYSGASVTSVLGEPGQPIRPLSVKRERELKWTVEDNKRVEELRQWWHRRHQPSVTPTIGELTGQAAVSLVARVVAIYQASPGKSWPLFLTHFLLRPSPKARGRHQLQPEFCGVL